MTLPETRSRDTHPLARTCVLGADLYLLCSRMDPRSYTGRVALSELDRGLPHRLFKQGVTFADDPSECSPRDLRRERCDRRQLNLDAVNAQPHASST